ncbi:MAG: hypothetical protein F6K09_20275 [Merismopedia sp. SIO2A8]|nr:hypothetical protein [Symploca sp. SIO2B6]NET50975.1 hypothetical protein [Merismopedia sp. SIO2A8]
MLSRNIRGRSQYGGALSRRFKVGWAIALTGFLGSGKTTLIRHVL